MLPTITDSAKDYLITMADKNDATNVHFGVKGGGCAGFKYDWSTIKTEEINPKDHLIKLNEVKNLIIDGVSLFYLMGCVIDFKEDFGGSQIVIENPQATSSCGCGESVGF
jgi:iron-sulfur cluster insertion protein